MNITILPYDPDWPLQFNEEADLLRKRISQDCLVEHIGSTSVPGLSAKPIIDVLVGIPPNEELDLYPEVILQDGAYVYVSHWETVMPFRRFFIKLDDAWDRGAHFLGNISDDSILRLPVEPRKYHIHLVRADHPFFVEHIRFRDLLRSNRDLRSEYQHLKEDLAQQNWNNSAEYAGAKTEFIEMVLNDYSI